MTSLSLLHLCDSLFPLGAFAHSDGLEAATVAGTISTGDDLRRWMDACLEEGLTRFEGPALSMAWCATAEGALSTDRLLLLDADVHAMRPSSTARQASRAMGTRLLKTWAHIYPGQIPDGLASLKLTLPVAFGVVCRCADISESTALESYFYTRLAATVSSAMRLMPIGQHEAHRLLGRVLTGVPEAVRGVMERRDQPSAFMPMVDMAIMSQQYVVSRLFRS
jgi:urease accessory protein